MKVWCLHYGVTEMMATVVRGYWCYTMSLYPLIPPCLLRSPSLNRHKRHGHENTAPASGDCAWRSCAVAAGRRIFWRCLDTWEELGGRAAPIRWVFSTVPVTLCRMNMDEPWFYSNLCPIGRPSIEHKRRIQTTCQAATHGLTSQVESRAWCAQPWCRWWCKYLTLIWDLDWDMDWVDWNTKILGIFMGWMS